MNIYLKSLMKTMYVLSYIEPSPFFGLNLHTYWYYYSGEGPSNVNEMQLWLVIVYRQPYFCNWQFGKPYIHFNE